MYNYYETDTYAANSILNFTLDVQAVCHSPS